ncbi:hypothetical protein SESBI_31684 [Sesbania bispinosa]|nr:hypothetical protein SESBI_31684 [Sesbania bispinosa]
MEQSIGIGDGSYWSEREREIGQVLVELHRVCLSHRIALTWGCKRRRSAIQDNPYLSSLQNSLYSHGGANGAAAVVAPPSCNSESQTVVKAEASSPATPLSFSPTESDEKPNRSQKRKPSMKRKRENYLTIIEDLTQRKALLNQEIDNVKRHYDRLKAFNLKLKARKQDYSLSNGPKSESKNPNLEFGQATPLVHANDSVNTCNSTAENEEQKDQQQHLQIHSTPHCPPLKSPNQNQTFGPGHPTTSLRMPSSSSSAMGLVDDSNKGPRLPDLNEALVHVDSCQPLDATMANKDLGRAMAAQARQRRLQIYRLKKPIGNSKPRISYR